MRATRHVEVDPRRGDRARKDVERHVADDTRGADVPAKVVPAEREAELRKTATGLTDELSHPVAPKLVAVAVEEDVVLLRHVDGREELWIDRPEKRFDPSCAELEEARYPAFRIREHE